MDIEDVDFSKFNFEFDNKTGLLFKYYYGKITIEDIATTWEYAIKNEVIPRETRGFVLDYRAASFNLKEEEHNKISQFYQRHIDVFGNTKIAILTENPKDIVIPILVETKDNGYKSKPFYTLDAAIKWVLG